MPTISKELQTNNLRAGAVLLYLDFVFPGDEVSSPKWIIILSDNLLEEEIFFVLTTSQIGTYSGSRRSYILVTKEDEQCFEKDCIIEIEQIYPININTILTKYNTHRIIHKDFISGKLQKQIFDKIAECSTIPDYIKDVLGVYD